MTRVLYIGYTFRFAGLAGVRIQQLLDESSCTVVIKKRLRVTNHIGGVVVALASLNPMSVVHLSG